jgi:hypothetical protein
VIELRLGALDAARAKAKKAKAASTTTFFMVVSPLSQFDLARIVAGGL